MSRPAPDDDGQDPDLSVADWETMKTRLLDAQCPTCVFRPGNPMHLHAGRLRDLIAQAVDSGGYIVCHKTLPGLAPAGFRPAICRGFKDRYDTQALQIAERLWGFTEVTLPGG